MRVLPDAPAIDKTFDYTIPERWEAVARMGSVVRVQLHGRRVGGWIVDDDVEPQPGRNLLPIAKVTGIGPPAPIFDLAAWAAWRWAGRRAHFLRTATHERAVTALPAASGPPAAPRSPVTLGPVVRECFSRPGVTVVRLPPATDPFDLAAAAAARPNALLLAPSIGAAKHLGIRLRRAGLPVAVLPDDWPLARAGTTVVASRAGAWAPLDRVGAVLVLDEHDEAYREERSPTWHARDVAVERARRDGVPCVLVSPVPTLEAQAAGRLLTLSRSDERDGWPAVDVVDRRIEDQVGSSLVSERLAALLRSGGRVVCVLNRKGRSRLLACKSCAALQRCENCDGAVNQAEDRSFRCGRCLTSRPAVCQACGATTFKNLKVGVTRVREELEAFAREQVIEVTADDGGAPGEPLPESRVYVGTEAVLHRVRSADAVVFLDFDQELLAPRYRAAEQALALLARGARVAGGRRSGGRLAIQTRLPMHEVVQAAVLADPGRASRAEAARRALLRFPPDSAIATVTGAAAPAFIERFGAPPGVEVLGPADGRWLLRARDHVVLCDALAATSRPAGRLRIEVDPLRI